jgi:hypothetical protein
MLSNNLFRLVFCLFGFNQNIETLYYGMKKTEKTVTTLNFLEKFQNMLSIKLFRLLFCLFLFNQNTETLCFGIEVKQPK